MSSNLNVEKCDNLKYPCITGVFSDVAWIKTENIHEVDTETIACQNGDLPSESKEDVLNEKEERADISSHSSSNDCKSLTYKNSVLSRNKIILGSNIPNKTNFQYELIDDSKPKPERDPFSATVIVKDWGVILRNHPFYCHECLILFTSQDKLNAHTETHSLLLPKEKIEVEIIKIDSNKYDRDGKYFICPMCGKHFMNHYFYQSHIDGVHNILNLLPLHEEFSGDCVLCTDRGFPNVSSLHNHINSYHLEGSSLPTASSTAKGVSDKSFKYISSRKVAIKSTSDKNERSNKRCRKGKSQQGATLGNVPLKSTAQKMVLCKPDLKSTNSIVESKIVASNDSDDDGEMKYLICPACGVYYRFLKNYAKHCNRNHQAIYLSPIRNTFSGICKCGVEYSTIKAFNSHVLGKHKSISTKVMKHVQEYFCFECEISFPTLEQYDVHSYIHKTDKDKAEEEHSYSIEPIRENSKNDDGLELVWMAKGTIFKCPKCLLHFMSCKTAFIHSNTCLATKPKAVCDICNRAMRPQDIPSHKLQHQMMSNINVIDMSKNIFYRLTLVCSECKVGIDGHSVHVSHASECKTKKSDVCTLCDVNIAAECRDTHARMHANNIKPLIIQFICGKISDLKRLISTENNILYYCGKCKAFDPIRQVEHHKEGNCTLEKIHICRLCGLGFSYDNHVNHTLAHKNKTINLTEVRFIDIETDNEMKEPISDWGQYGNDGKITFPDNNGQRKSFRKKTAVFCINCQVSYNEVAYNIHLRYHEHSTTNTKSDLVKRLTEPSLVAFSGDDLAVDYEEEHLSHNIKKRHAVEKKSLHIVKKAKLSNSAMKTLNKNLLENPEDLKTIYQCSICNLNFMLFSTLHSHLLRHKTQQKIFPIHACSVCGLKFQSRSLWRHVYVHHTRMKLQLEDLKIRIYHDMHNYTIKVGSDSPTHGKRRSNDCFKVEPAKKGKCIKAAPSKAHIRPSKKYPLSKQHIQTRKTSKAHSSPIATSSAVYSESSVQLFKCAHCDVYFTNDALCYDHTLNHIPLDTTEYIGCKVCDIELVCECLGIHMKGHREGTFNIENLIIKEFIPTKGAPLIKTYLARDVKKT